MEITLEQIYAVECLSAIEDLYLAEIDAGDNIEVRKRIEPLRECIEFLMAKYKIDETVRADFMKYVQTLRLKNIYEDKLQKMTKETKSDELLKGG